VNIFWSTRQVGSGQLSEEQREEVQTILKRMATTNLVERIDPVAARESLETIAVETHSAEQTKGLKIITLSFLWRAENHVLSLSESSCTDELRRLLEIAGTALGGAAGLDAPQDLCRGSDEHQRQPQALTLPIATSTPFANLPGGIRASHAAPLLFYATWFGQPSDGVYHQLTLFAHNRLMYQWFVDDGAHQEVRGILTEKERREVNIILNMATSMSPIEQSVGTIIVFPNAGDSSCSNDLYRLFEIADVTLRRESPDFGGFQNPCQER
jgi:hypothetical protein